MSDKELPSFKAGAKQASGGRARAKPAATKSEPATQAPTLGFARIEEILDREQPKDLQQQLGALADSLDAVIAGEAAAKDKGNAKRAKLAVSKTVELLASLFQTKQQMLNDYLQHKAKTEGKSPAKGSKPAPQANKGGR